MFEDDDEKRDALDQRCDLFASSLRLILTLTLTLMLVLAPTLTLT
jgi:hypothetical protein